MDYLEFISAQASTNAIIESLKVSIAEIKEKRPNAFDYIEGMEKHLKSMMEVFMHLKQCEKEITTLKSISFNYHKENMELKYENSNLNQKVDHLMQGL